MRGGSACCKANRKRENATLIPRAPSISANSCRPALPSSSYPGASSAGSPIGYRIRWMSGEKLYTLIVNARTWTKYLPSITATNCSNGHLEQSSYWECSMKIPNLLKIGRCSTRHCDCLTDGLMAFATSSSCWRKWPEDPYGNKWRVLLPSEHNHSQSSKY